MLYFAHMTSIVTKTGDDGSTGLYGGQRVGKDSLRIEAYGTVDELNAHLGVILATLDFPTLLSDQLKIIQHLLFRVGGDLATPYDVKTKQDRVEVKHTEQIETWIKEFETALPPQKSFILPGGSLLAAHIHTARTVCRRAERHAVTLHRSDRVNDEVLKLLNRLSDYLFLLARVVNKELRVGDTEVRY